MDKNKSLNKLNQAKQSIWYDNLSRDVLNNGELKKLIDQGISGLTSNPTIFKQAIADTNTYDQNIKSLAQENLDAEKITETLMIEDVAAAADLLRPIYDQSNASDGYASIEVSPLLANDTQATISAAQSFWAKLNRPNIMIKVPATEEGLSAIQTLLSEGINVNVTLIFSLEYYQKVMDAYITALEKRVGDGLQIDKIASVASFFISRNDAWLEKQFAKLISDKPELEQYKDQFFGKVGLANGFSAFNIFNENFKSERFQKLQDQGAQIQRILWASTGVKNPNLDPLHYALKLPFANSVATHPPAIIEHLMQFDGEIKEPESIDSNAVYAVYNTFGLKLENMFNELLTEGVQKFADSYNELIEAVNQQIN